MSDIRANYGMDPRPGYGSTEAEVGPPRTLNEHYAAMGNALLVMAANVQELETYLYGGPQVSASNDLASKGPIGALDRAKDAVVDAARLGERLNRIVSDICR